MARVRTEDGADVTVLGTPDRRSHITSVDRTYEVGARYEFHPINDTSPFEDTICSATRLLERNAVPAPGVDQPPHRWLLGGAAAGGAIVVAAVVILLRRSRSPSARSAPGH